MNENKQQQQPPPQRKRRRRENTNDSVGVVDADVDVKQVKTKGLNEIITSLILLEDQEKNDLDELEKANQEERLQLEENHSKRTRAMMDYYSDLQDYHKDAERAEGTRKRKAKANAFAATNVAAMAIGTAGGAEDSVSSEQNLAANDKAPAAGPQRRLWVKNRSKDWWDQCNSPDFPEEEFKKAFRMGKETFDLICNELSSVVAKENTMLRDAVPVRQRVAVCIWRLATGEPLRLVSKKFGLGISTCHKLVLEVCSAIRSVLMPKYLRWPDEESVRRIKEEFESISGIPNVVGSMYTTHIPIIAPKISVAAYFNRRHTERNQKTSYSITVQGVVDPRGVFTDVCIGYPSMTDDQQHLTWTQHAFNEKIGEIQRIAKESFARLKGRWGCLQKRTEVKLQDLPVVLGACCVLHNICELRNERLDPSLKFELIDDEMVPEIGLRSANAMKARDTIAHNLLHHNHAGTSFLS
ncbi:hypothetical protein Sango_2209600 [Sesamum angolense]|uniref:DDE Tnp4 domain-containing protein n=1 Tax=Sesamum angolense TaxID=2727404 RepID=A0AAE1W8W1_9LAMI|nr:hypothetical protein Sango_2209600 [Sesamum angolense]